MWNPDKAPVMGFENLARHRGVAKARAIFAAYKEKLRLDNVKAALQEKRAAELRRQRGPLVVRNDFDMMPMFHLAPLSWKQVYRSEIDENGNFVGDRQLYDKGTLKDFLKRNPDCAPQQIVSGKIQGGWVPSLDRAAKEGRMHRALQYAQASLRLQHAAQEGRRALVA